MRLTRIVLSVLLFVGSLAVAEAIPPLKLYPPSSSFVKQWTSQDALVTALRDKFAFGVMFADDELTKAKAENIGGIGPDGKVFHLTDWPSRTTLEGKGTVYLFRARSYYGLGTFHWAIADIGPAFGLDFSGIAGGLTKLEATRVESRTTETFPHSYSWQETSLGVSEEFEIKKGQEIVLLVRHKVDGTRQVLRRFETPQSRREPTPPWGSWGDPTESWFRMPTEFWHPPDQH